MNRSILFATLTTMAALTLQHAEANAYKILGVKSTKATALGEAFIVRADDPSAIVFNPAGLAQQRGSHVSLQGTFCNAYTIDYDGDLTVSGNQMPLSVDIDFPRAVIGGIAVRPNADWTLEFNLDWTEWEKVEDYRIVFENPNVPEGTQIQQLENTLAYKFGAEYA
jgi:long-subunit fatty acid transport protein